jgi:hypothetical protein
LSLKTRLRSLGLYHEEFSIIYTAMDEEANKKPMKYKILEKGEVNKVISENEGNCQEIVRAWQQLMVEHEPMQLA